MYDARKHICFNLGQVMRRVYDYYEQRLSPFSLTPSQYFVFNALWMGDGISVGELGERVSLDSSTLPGIIDRMERSGYVERRPNPDDRRSVLVFLTAIALGNMGDPLFIPDLAQATQDSEQMVRGCAAWALGRIGGSQARQILEASSARETAESVKRESEAAQAVA